jgi:hypothetical protein
MNPKPKQFSRKDAKLAKKGQSFGLRQDLKISFASFAALRETLLIWDLRF